MFEMVTSRRLGVLVCRQWCGFEWLYQNVKFVTALAYYDNVWVFCSNHMALTYRCDVNRLVYNRLATSVQYDCYFGNDYLDVNDVHVWVGDDKTTINRKMSIGFELKPLDVSDDVLVTQLVYRTRIIDNQSIIMLE